MAEHQSPTVQENSTNPESVNIDITNSPTDANIEVIEHRIKGPSANKVLLTSKRNSKHVTFLEPRGNIQNQDIYHNCFQIIDNVDNCVTNGLTELRAHLSSLIKDRSAMIQHIRSLEESLSEANESYKIFRSKCEEKDSEIKNLQLSLKEKKSLVEKLNHKNESIQSDHSDHLHSIATVQRRKRLAKRSVEKWKQKIKSKDSCELSKLKTENALLKQELIVYQESTKQAFLRSANVLNSEALTIFQNSTKRILNSDEPLSRVDEHRGDNCSSSGDSTSSSSSPCDPPDDCDAPMGDENYMKRPRKSVKKREKQIIVSRSRSQNDVESRIAREGLRSRDYHSSPVTLTKPRVGDYVPQQLRKETRHMIEQLQSSRNPSNYSSSPSICYCKTNGSISCKNCCSSTRFNLGLASMPVNVRSPSRTANDTNFSRSHLEKFNSRNVLLANMNKTDGRSKIIYQPSGSTVVIEKHLK